MRFFKKPYKPVPPRKEAKPRFDDDKRVEDIMKIREKYRVLDI